MIRRPERVLMFIACLGFLFACAPSGVKANPIPDYHSSACVKVKGEFCIESISIGDFISHFQSVGGESVVVPELVITGRVQLGSPLWHLELRHFRGTSTPLADGFQASVGDFEGRIERRLDDPYDTDRQDSISRNIMGWVSWKIWTDTNLTASTSVYERDEGLGFGVTRFPSRTGLSYWYEASLYPSVRTNIADQKNAYTFSAGGVYNLVDSLALTLGYRIQTIRTGTRKTDRAEEQGFIFGLRGSF